MAPSLLLVSGISCQLTDEFGGEARGGGCYGSTIADGVAGIAGGVFGQGDGRSGQYKCGQFGGEVGFGGKTTERGVLDLEC